MFLSIDIGNTDIVLGFNESGNWKVFRCSHQSSFNAFLSEKVSQPLLSKVEKAGLSSVVPNSTDRIIKALNEYRISPVEIKPDLYETLPIAIPNPGEIGTDLVCNALAAFEKFKSDCLIIDFGTALTFTVVVDRSIKGVNIAPGLKTSMKALVGSAAQLNEIELKLPNSVIGTNTETAIQSGVLWGYVGLVERMIERIESELKLKLKIVATGGLSEVLQPLQSQFDLVDRNLTLEGIRQVTQS
ncbi:type III pantothenate kinase [Fulvivirga sp. RKSG066]|uniref:type III pantothenate kinase n=1 Tax=Fulvivirga aurantia TaxID=2529383 RepID=UPI0012BB5E64|nr:type III pantothenate kinase [Fulvivirga aurantia]MTI20064.1 type III pantothenate kinase [Fulvivirga aurantia]